jgi:hypothetical protein
MPLLIHCMHIPLSKELGETVALMKWRAKMCFPGAGTTSSSPGTEMSSPDPPYCLPTDMDANSAPKVICYIPNVVLHTDEGIVLSTPRQSNGTPISPGQARTLASLWTVGKNDFQTRPVL